MSVRRDPRGERAAMVVAVTPRVRLDRAHRGGAVAAEVAVVEAAAGVVRVAGPAFVVFAVVEAVGGVLGRHDRQVIGAARVLAGRDAAVVVLGVAGAVGHGVGDAGGDGAMGPLSAGYDPEVAAAVIGRAMAMHAPRHVVFGESADAGDLARRVAALCDEELFAGAESVSARLVVRPAQGGRVEMRGVPGRLISIAPDRVAPYAGVRHATEAIAAPDAVAVERGIVAAERLAVAAATIPLDQAPLVIAAGNGVVDFAGFLGLAEALGATPGASRVVCDAGALPRAMQVGASGTVLDAECYIALGISGAPQHLQGIGTVERIVAVNTDLHAAIVARAGLAIVADAQAVMVALRAML